MTDRPKLVSDRGGSGEALLVLIHGLGANARVWQPMLATADRHWSGRWIAPDLRGHGGSDAASSYRVSDYAADLGALVAAEAAGGPVTLLGHSLGGVIALALASGDFGIRPTAVFCLGIKVNWADEELEKLAQLAAKPARAFESEADALGFYARQSGLGVTDPASPLVDRAVAQIGEGGWRTAVDMRAFAVERPAMAALLAGALCPVRLARGERDPMVSDADLAALDADAATIAGAGHNAMVDTPEQVWTWVGQ
jgi:pimeloyl-ACP methyl ester carboxylesterase